MALAVISAKLGCSGLSQHQSMSVRANKPSSAWTTLPGNLPLLDHCVSLSSASFIGGTVL